MYWTILCYEGISWMIATGFWSSITETLRPTLATTLCRSEENIPMKKIDTRKHQNGQNVFLSSSFRWLAQYCMNLSGGLCTKQQHFIRNSARPITFSQFTTLKSHESLTEKLWFCLGCHFLHLYTCALKDHLAMIQNYYSRLLN